MPIDSLRALLIQKDVKHFLLLHILYLCLRALLIQKDVKQINNMTAEEAV